MKKYRITQRGWRAQPSAKQNIETWLKVKQAADDYGVLTLEELEFACSSHDHPAGGSGFIQHISRPMNKWIEPVD